MVVSLPLLGIMFGFSMFIVGTISYTIGYDHGKTEEHDRLTKW